jgi:hypothetical protein
MAWPKPGEPLPRYEEAYGIEEKLERYSLNARHPAGRHKLRRFEERLGIKQEDVGVLAIMIRSALKPATVTAVREVAAGGVTCEIILYLDRGRGAVPVVTAWHLAAPDAMPRLVTAYVGD